METPVHRQAVARGGGGERQAQRHQSNSFNEEAATLRAFGGEMSS
jgi:hypothetical protein